MDKLVIQFEKPSLELDNNNNIMDIRKMGSFVSYIYPKLEDSKLNYTIEISFPLCLIEPLTLQKMINEEKISTCCHIQKGNGIVFDVTGEVIPCNHFLGYPFKEEALNVKNLNAIEELLQSDIVKELKENVKRYPTFKCIDCELWSLCGGGCFTRWFYIDPKEYI